MSVIQEVLWQLESQANKKLPLEEIADRVNLSPFHLSRIFAMATGITMSAYSRARRLTDAACTLGTGAPDILTVALDAGYNSHEAFTRAFRAQFGVTPETVRKRRSTDGLSLMQPLRASVPKPVQLGKPEIKTLKPMSMIGLEQRHKMDGQAAIPGQWMRFQPFIGNIDGARTDQVAYGIVREAGSNADQFNYMCAVEVVAGTDAPDDLTAIKLPAMRVAAFRHNGHVSTLLATCNAIYAHGLADNGVKPARNMYMFEYYGPKLGVNDIEIWIAIAP